MHAYHTVVDGFGGYRSRLDDIHLVHELLEKLPLAVGARPVMPAFVLPYYNGVLPDDCGISSFVFLDGGHLTLHTFSFREALFLDILTPHPVDDGTLRSHIEAVFPCQSLDVGWLDRRAAIQETPPLRSKLDFGPHLTLTFDDYAGPTTLDSLFDFLDRAPAMIGMTPIMRPYVMRNAIGPGSTTSGMTMIAESHLSLHVFEDPPTAYMDLFSCSFFDADVVVPLLVEALGGHPRQVQLKARGVDYVDLRVDRQSALQRSRSWLRPTPGAGPASG